MPTEERYIKFNFEEVKKALLIYSIEKKSEALAPGEISAVSLNQDNGAINVVIDQENGDKITTEIKQEFFVPAMVFSCQAHKIPLPRDTRKLISFTETGVIMMIDFQNADKQDVEKAQQTVN